MPFLFQSSPTSSIKVHTQVACAVTFVLFSFCYLLFYQPNVLAAGQHVLSKGQTTYVGWVGAVLITITLLLLQRVVFAFTKLSKRAHAITFFPSMLVLTIITDVSSNIDLGFSFGGWYVAVPLLMALFAAVVWAARQMEPFEPEPATDGFMSRTIWVNLLVMMIMMVAVGLFSNTDEAFHYRMEMEQCIVKGKYNKALKVGRNSQVRDPQLTLLRTFALTKKRQLGERFFEYPFIKIGETLLPDTIGNRVILLDDSTIATVVKSARARLDYKLVDMLIDKDLEKFKATVVKAYPDSLMPKHYAEALALYKHLTGKEWRTVEKKKDEGKKDKKGRKKKKEKQQPVEEEVAKVDPMLLRLQDFLKLKQEKGKKETKLLLWKHFGKTYWYYYFDCQPY